MHSGALETKQRGNTVRAIHISDSDPELRFDEPAIAIATRRAGELAIADFEYARDQDAATQAIRQWNEALRAPFGIKLSGEAMELFARVTADPPENLKTVILTSSRPSELEEQVRRLRERKITTLLETTCLEHARTGATIGVDGFVAKGHEAGGRVGDETTFILLQRFQSEIALPVWAHGGIGLHTAAACAAAGAAGIILDYQLALTRESPLNEWIKARIASMDGSETICLGEQLGELYRIYFRPGYPAVRELQELEPAWPIMSVLRRKYSPIGARRFSSALGWSPIRMLRSSDRMRRLRQAWPNATEPSAACCGACEMPSSPTAPRRPGVRPLAPDSPLAQSHQTRFPILQGPMTRVSDVPEFAARVAEEGALPFLALALMRGPEVRSLLAQTQRRIGTMSWGVGILGFVPPELRQEQLDVIREYRPPFALIAGGRPDQASALEQQGISTYLHVPSPGLLEMFVQQGARRFVFEGRECGGHVGPRTSFVLWNQMVDVLLNAPELQANPQEFHIAFAAGIHDALSAAMVSVIAAPLAERGVRVGCLLGTGYLFTEEAVSSGAIQRTFQDQARECRRTVLLETGPGHSTRCVDTPYANSFTKEKRRLLTLGMPAEEVRLALENLNLGRFRVAAKGVTRHPQFDRDPAAPKLMEIGEAEQVTQGMYMIGQLAALRNGTCTIRELHNEVSVKSLEPAGELSRSFLASSFGASDGISLGCRDCRHGMPVA